MKYSSHVSHVYGFQIFMREIFITCCTHIWFLNFEFLSHVSHSYCFLLLSHVSHAYFFQQRYNSNIFSDLDFTILGLRFYKGHHSFFNYSCILGVLIGHLKISLQFSIGLRNHKSLLIFWTLQLYPLYWRHYLFEQSWKGSG